MNPAELPLFTSLVSTFQQDILPQKEQPSQLPTEELLPRQVLQNALNGIFPQKEEESTVIKMRRILGEQAERSLMNR